MIFVNGGEYPLNPNDKIPVPYYTEVEIKCYGGFTLVRYGPGPLASEEPVSMCDKHGHWLPALAECIEDEPMQLAVENVEPAGFTGGSGDVGEQVGEMEVKISSNGCLLTPIHSGLYFVDNAPVYEFESEIKPNQVVRLECFEGFSRRQSAVGESESVCNEGGIWTPPLAYCEPDDVPVQEIAQNIQNECHLPKVENGRFVVNGAPYDYYDVPMPSGTEIKLKCDNGDPTSDVDPDYTGFSRCKPAGYWNPPVGKCRLSFKLVEVKVESEPVPKKTMETNVQVEKQSQQQQPAAEPSKDLCKMPMEVHADYKVNGVDYIYDGKVPLDVPTHTFVRVTCHSGYNFDWGLNRTSVQSKCKPDGQWDPYVAHCVKTSGEASDETSVVDTMETCNAPRIFNASFVINGAPFDYDGTYRLGVPLHTLISVTCIPGFEFDYGTKTSVDSTCLKDGSWSKHVPNCIKSGASAVQKVIFFLLFSHSHSIFMFMVFFIVID